MFLFFCSLIAELDWNLFLVWVYCDNPTVFTADSVSPLALELYVLAVLCSISHLESPVVFCFVWGLIFCCSTSYLQHVSHLGMYSLISLACLASTNFLLHITDILLCQYSKCEFLVSSLLSGFSEYHVLNERSIHI